MYLILNEVLFKRTLKEAVRSVDEAAARWPIFLAVTKESNGYAVWHSSESVCIIAWSGDRDAAIKHAATISPADAEGYVNRLFCKYDLPPSHLEEQLETLSF